MAEGRAFVDGSYNKSTKVYGYGGFLDAGGRRYPLLGHGSNPEMASMHNVAGEISGAMAAVLKAEELGLSHVTILYDYEGIRKWADGGWKARKRYTAAYRDFMNSPARTVSIAFRKVAAHTGVEGNEVADAMAKHAAGIPLGESQRRLVAQALASLP